MNPRLYWAAVLAALLLEIYMLVVSGPILLAQPGNLLPFDARLFGYDHAYALDYLSHLNDASRTYYLTTQRWLDSIFPALLGLAFGLTIARFYRGRRVVLLLLAPLAGAVFDYLENAAVAVMLRADNVTLAMVNDANRWTAQKYLAILVSVVSIVLILIRYFRSAK